MEHGVIIVQTNHGFICANAGIDESNVENGYATLLPKDSDKSAQEIRLKILQQTGKKIAVIISDTFGRPFRMGQTDHAIGMYLALMLFYIMKELLTHLAKFYELLLLL